MAQKKHIVAISFTPEVYHKLQEAYARKILEGNTFVDGRTNVGTILTEAVFCILGERDAPDNPIIKDFLARQG